MSISPPASSPLRPQEAARQRKRTGGAPRNVRTRSSPRPCARGKKRHRASAEAATDLRLAASADIAVIVATARDGGLGRTARPLPP
jgi:hypothetical protein